MLKETETEETIDFLSLMAFQLGGEGTLRPLLATPLTATSTKAAFGPSASNRIT